MRFVIAVIVSLMTMPGIQPEPRTVRREFHANGVPSLEAEYRDSVRDGVYRTWYADGRPYEVRHYVNGRESGRQQSWTPDGVLYLNYEMRDGRRFGFVNSAPCLPVAPAPGGASS
jgi:antitoxin component YwqK of YwqJK toxin-antitoxin module